MTRDLMIRQGARFSCGGDGLCCSDVHALGPLSRRERDAMLALDASGRAVVTHPRLGLPVLAPKGDHTCHFFDRVLGCRVHHEHGALAKPAACRQFPFGLVDTPEGLRVTTAHRCPCRTMGDRAPLDPEEARRALTAANRKGLRIDQTIDGRIPLTRRRRVSFARYRALEAPIVDRLLSGTLVDELVDVPRLGASEDSGSQESDTHGLPPIELRAWGDVAHSHRAMVDGSTTGEALGWFGDALLHLLEGKRLGLRERPWAWSFARAEQRPGAPRSGREVLSDFAADRIFSLRWAEDSSLAGELLTLSVVLRAGTAIAESLVALGTREERAFAESVMIAEVALGGPLAYVRFEDETEQGALAHVM